eukprot:5912943-Pleurochrysis_carterae.AAC.1
MQCDVFSCVTFPSEHIICVSLSEYQQYAYPFRPPYTPYIAFGEVAKDTLECWYSLTAACISVRSCYIALGANETRSNFIIVPTIGPLLADESTPCIAYLAIDACQETPIDVLASRGRWVYPQYGLPGSYCRPRTYAAFYACNGSPHFIKFGALAMRRISSLQEKHQLSQYHCSQYGFVREQPTRYYPSG